MKQNQQSSSNNRVTLQSDKKKISRLNSPKNELIEGKKLHQSKYSKMIAPSTTTNRNRLKTNSEYQAVANIAG